MKSGPDIETLRLINQREQQDCMRAAVATLLQRPYGHTPRVTTVGDGTEFWKRWAAWARRQDLQIVMAVVTTDRFVRSWAPFHRQHRTGVQIRTYPKFEPEPDELWIGSVSALSNWTYNHAVIMQGRKLLHDPDGGRLRVQMPTVRAAVLFEELT